ncbi:MAG TPA: hypothetical protein VGO37_18305 [Steroidobacteraceae bacterium]|jgi:hypothetical protein|nr:hypothetical protein [Steroidobacteraceae bacterium]
MTTWMRTAVLALLCNTLVQAQTPIPKELEGWQSWVQYGQEFRRCPFFAGTDGSNENNRICAWPGRLDLDLHQGGGRFSQAWVSYAEAWVSLPGNLEYWPSEVTVNGAAAAVVARDGVPQIRVPEGTSAVAGRFTWAKRPESLPIPPHTGLIELNLDGRRPDQVNRPNDAVWLGKRHEAEVAQQLDVQVYRLLSDGIPATLETRLDLQVAGEVREEVLPNMLPRGFQPMSLASELPARVDSDGRLRVQVRAGSWTITVAARAADNLGTITIPSASGNWPKQEVWSYAPDDRLRVAALEGAEAIDPAQAKVPEEWRRYPSYRIAAGGVVQSVEHSRGVSPQEGNHLVLQRELYLDFAHRGFTAVDQISGQMRSGWRLDMRAPYRLMRAGSGADDLLVTETEGAAVTGVELRRPVLNLGTVARIAVPGGVMPASGWTERMDHVSGVLNLPPGHRLLAALGTDSTPDAWVERWGLLDLFLLLITTVIALRLFGWFYAVIAFAAVALLHQENPLLVWLILSALLANALMRVIPEGWPRSAVHWSRNLSLGLLLLVSVPFAVTQVRFALYPQLADPDGFSARQEIAQLAAAPAGAALDRSAPNYAPARTSSASPAPAARLEEMVVAGAKQPNTYGFAPSSEPRQRYAPGTSIQAGPGVPHWRYAAYHFGWSGPVDAAQTVRFVVLPPVVVGIWRLLGVTLLAALFLRMLGGSLDTKAEWRRFLGTRGTVASCLVVALACMTIGSPSRAYSTPDTQLLNDLKTRLSRAPKCVPHCAEIMAARLVLTPTTLEASLDVAALSSVALALPTAGQRFDPDAITIDGAPVPGVYRDDDRQIWIALKPGAHTVKLGARLPTSDSIQLLFPQVPRGITVSGDGWDISGVNAGRLLGNTIELLRRRVAGHDADAPPGAVQFPPFARIRREFSLDLDWSLRTTIERLAPEKGGFTLEIPLLTGESVLTSGIETNNGTRVSAGFDSDATEFGWHSSLKQVDALALTAAPDKPWSEVWIFKVSPTWRVAFSGVPAVMPENLSSGDWTFEYFPRAGETLNLRISRPATAPGSTLAIDKVDLELEVGNRSTNAALRLNYRSTQGGRHSVRLPDIAHITAVTVDGQAVPVRPEKGVLPLAILPGAHQVRIDWLSSDAAALLTRTPHIDLELPSSNVNAVLRMPANRWVLYAGGSGVGPAILYWGELIVFIALAIAAGRSRRSPLRSHEWLLLGLGLSTFSWSALLLFAAWMFAMRWREGFTGVQLSRRQFNLLQSALFVLSSAAVITLLAAIPSGLLGNPDMRIAGIGQHASGLSWFNDQAPGVLPIPWVLSLSIWWYKTAMLLWALWLAFALVRWLPIAWKALGAGGLWRNAPPSAPPADART